jgi:hypothetical protein
VGAFAETSQYDRGRVAFFAERMEQEHEWFFHFVNLRSGAREWRSELSSIDTAPLAGGVEHMYGRIKRLLSRERRPGHRVLAVRMLPPKNWRSHHG